MTKLDLLARAKSLGIKGRHEMSKADLETAVAQREMISQVSDAAKEAGAELKAAVEGKVRRKPTNLNTPWQRKYYYVNEAAYEAAKANGLVAKAPMQVQLILKFMIKTGIVSYKQSQQGSSIASVAVSTGALVTIIEPHVLFAYYRKKMEILGLTFAGYNVGEGEDEGEEMSEDALADAAKQDEAAAEAAEDEDEDEAEGE